MCPGGVEGGEGGRLFPVSGSGDPRIITPQTPNAAQVLARNANVGWCHWNEQGLEAAYRALSTPLVDNADDPRTPQLNDGNAGFLRPDADLAVVFLSDDDDYSPQPVSFYETFFKSLKGNPHQVSVSAIMGPSNLGSCPTASSFGSRYIALASATGGMVESICALDWTPALEGIAASTSGLSRRFPLSATPKDPAQLVVRINGTPATGWTYRHAANDVLFTVAPPAGTIVELSYPPGC